MAADLIPRPCRIFAAARIRLVFPAPRKPPSGMMMGRSESGSELRRIAMQRRSESDFSRSPSSLQFHCGNAFRHTRQGWGVSEWLRLIPVNSGVIAIGAVIRMAVFEGVL